MKRHLICSVVFLVFVVDTAVLFTSCVCCDVVVVVAALAVMAVVIDSCSWSMGTTASAAPHPPVLHEGVHGNGMADSRQSLSVSSFQSVSIHNSKGKSIITNKVAPVVIT